MAAVDDNGGRQQQWRWQMTTTVTAGGRQQQQTTTAADDDSTQDRVADYKGEGGERALNNNGIRARQAESMKVKKSSLRKKTFFSDMVCPVGVFAPAEN